MEILSLKIQKPIRDNSNYERGVIFLNKYLCWSMFTTIKSIIAMPKEKNNLINDFLKYSCFENGEYLLLLKYGNTFPPSNLASVPYLSHNKSKIKIYFEV